MRNARCAICCALLTVLGWVAESAAAEPTIGVREGVVLLTNGELLTGTIIPAGDRYDVHLASGEIRLRRGDVAYVCGSAHECYLHKRAGIELGNAADHLALAEWCIRNKLLAEGEAELAAAQKADPAHPKLRLVASRLKLAQAPPPQPSGDAVKPVAHIALDSVARNLPPGSMESFTVGIQPLLLNYCSKAGCHSSRGAAALKLERIHPKLSGRSATQRNLQRVLALVNRQDPPNSPLLQAPIRPHGTLEAPIFTDRQQSQYRQLVQWVYLVAGAKQPLEPMTLEERTAPLLQAVPGATGAAVTPASAEEPAAPAAGQVPGELVPGELVPGELPPAELPPGEVPPVPAPAGELSPDDLPTPEGGPNPRKPATVGPEMIPSISSAPLKGRIQRGAKIEPAFQPRDEFDPEIFNRRFFGG